MRAYQAVQLFRPLPSTLLLLASLVWGSLLGLGAFAISLFLPLPPLLAVGMGALGGQYLQWGIQRWAIAHRLTVIVCAAALALAGFGAFHYAEYVRFVGEMRARVAPEIGTDAFAATHAAVQDELRRATGYTGFWGYLPWVVQEGLTLGRTGQTGGLTLRGPLVWLYWALELALIAGVALALALERVQRPFCATCGTWYLPEQVGRVPGDEATRFLERLRAGAYQAAGEGISLRYLLRPYLSLYVAHCACERGESILTVSDVRENAQGQVQYKPVLQAWLTAEEENQLLDATSEWEA